MAVRGALRIEPTKNEGKDGLGALVHAMQPIGKEPEECPDLLRQAFVSAPLRRLDETAGAHKSILR